MMALLLAATNLSQAQDAKVVLLYPENGATGIIDPINGNLNGDMRWIFRWAAVDGATGYELDFRDVNYPNWQRLSDFWPPTDTTITMGSPDGVWCCFGRAETYLWRVRAIVDDTARTWSDEWSFTTADWIVPNDKDQQMLDMVGWYKPTVWDSTKFYYTEDVAEDILELHKESYKAQGDLIGHIGSSIYIFGADEALWDPVLDQNYEDCMKGGDYCERAPHWMGINRGVAPNLVGTPNKGIGHRWIWSSVDENADQNSDFIGPGVLQDTHEWTHNFESSRSFSGGNYNKGTPLWFLHMTSAPFGYVFDRDYGYPLNAKYESNYIRGVTDSTGNGYTTTVPAEPDHTRHSLSWIFDSFPTDETAKRDSMLRADERYTSVAGHYLAYLTSPQLVFIDRYDDRAWTKPFEQQFEDAFGMTVTEFSQKFYDWMLTVNANNWTYILPTEHSTELFRYPKLFTTSLPADGAEAVGRKPDFAWVASTDFSSYQIQLSLSQNFSSPVYTMDVEGATSVYQDEVTSATLDSALEPNTAYYWRMRSILGVNESDWTEPKSFTTGDLEVVGLSMVVTESIALSTLPHPATVFDEVALTVRGQLLSANASVSEANVVSSTDSPIVVNMQTQWDGDTGDVDAIDFETYVNLGYLQAGTYDVVLQVNGLEVSRSSIAILEGPQPEGPVSIDFNTSAGDQGQRLAKGARSGREYTLDLNIANVDAINGWNITVAFDSDQVEYVASSFAPGSFIPGLIALEDLSKVNRVSIGGTVLGTDGQGEGSGTLGQMRFRVAEEFSGETTLQIVEVALRSVDGQQIKLKVLHVVTLSDEVDLVGDSDGNGVVDFNDFFAFADAFGTTDPAFDYDGSGQVDFNDFFIFADNFGRGAQAKLIAMAQEMIGLPEQSGLLPNYPNPFNMETTIPFQVLLEGEYLVAVYNTTGQLVRTLHSGFIPFGLHTLSWNGLDDQAQPVSSGVYLVALRGKDMNDLRKIMLLK